MKIKQNNIDKLKKLIEESLFKGDSPITEATLSKATLEKREEILKNLKKNKKELVKRYGKDAEAVMYGRATNLAKKALSEMNKQKLKELVRKSLMNEADLEVMADKIGGEEELSLASNLLDDFESKLKSHDWYYMMSDDNRAYTKGSAEESELKKIAKQLASMGYDKDAANLYNKYNVFKATTFDSFITPPQPFIPGYKRKQMGLDEEAEFSKEYDNNPALKGGQKKLPDALQKSIIKKETGKVDEDIDLGHEDNEPHMIKGELYRIGKYAMELYGMLEEFEEMGGEVDFPAWWQSKITTAMNNMVSAKHYLDFEIKEPAIDAAVDALTGEEPHMGEPEAPMMEGEVEEVDKLAAKIAKALKDKANQSAEDQNNIKQARKAMNKGDIKTAEKIAKPYLSEKIAKQLKEWTDDNFSGGELISKTKTPTDISMLKKFFPTGVKSMRDAKASLLAHDKSEIKARMGRYAPMFVHVQYHEFEDQNGEKYRVHQTQYYNSNFDKQDPNFNPSVTKLSLIKVASPNGPSEDTNIGSILVKTEDYIKDLKNLNITNRAM